LISLDGLRPEFSMDERWPAPTLQQLCWEGAYAHAVRGVFPSLTYPAHTTIVTGALPARHGILFNEPFEPRGQTGRWYWEASAIRVPALWDAVRAAGLASAAVSWPVTVGADIDWNVPDVWPLRRSGDAIREIRNVTRPPGLLEEIEREATGRLREENFSIYRLTREDRVGAIAAYLLERYRPNLLLVHLIGVDHVQHELGTSNPEVRRAVGAADRAIGQILEVVERLGLRDRAAFIVTGDHGEVDAHTELRPNVLLVEAGLMEDRPDRGCWRATFHASGGAAFLHLPEQGDGAAVSEVLRLLDAVHPGVRRLFRVVGREELNRVGADPEAPLALAAVPGVTLSSASAGPLLRPAQGAAHGYFPETPEMYTGFVGSGAGFRRGATAKLLPLESVAPLVAALLDIELDAPDGVLLPGLLESAPSDRIAGRGPRRVDDRPRGADVAV
jgi:hypothetical protein